LIDFDGDLTDVERQDIISRVITLETRGNCVAYTTAHLDTLRQLLLKVTRLLIDDTQFTAEVREDRRSLDELLQWKEYRHELLMAVDEEYMHAWLYDHSEEYRETADAEPHNMLRVEAGRIEHTYREEDPYIVDPSLLRHFMRPLRQGENYPPSVIGKYATDAFIMPSISNENVVPELTVV